MDCATILHRWRNWIRLVVVVIYIVLLVIAVPLCIWELEREGKPDHIQAWFIGGMFVLMALPISFWGILQHVIHYNSPYLQRYIIRILWMVPIYGLNAWFALRFYDAAIYLDSLRECYEAYVIYNFMAYLLSFLHHEHPDLSSEVENESVGFIFPLCLLPPCKNGRKFMQRCKHGVMQYTLVRPLMTFIAFVCELCGKYEEGDFNFKSAWSYIVIFNNLSQIFAMYCLVMFYRAFRHKLKPIKPVPKFLCVKAVVFLSFWQGLLIAFLNKVGAIPTNGGWIYYHRTQDISTALQDFLICIEMFLAAIAHYFSFSHQPFVNLAVEQQNCCSSFFSMWDVRDVTGDVAEHARFLGRGMQKTLNIGKRFVTRSDERTPLLSEPNITSVRNDQLAAPDGVSLEDDNRSIQTASMNNFAVFENSTEDQLGGMHKSVSLHGYITDEDEVKDRSERPPDNFGETEETRNKGLYSSIVPDPSDEFEHLTKADSSDEENVGNNIIPSESHHAGSTAVTENFNSLQTKLNPGLTGSVSELQSLSSNCDILQLEASENNNPVV